MASQRATNTFALVSYTSDMAGEWSNGVCPVQPDATGTSEAVSQAAIHNVSSKSGPEDGCIATKEAC